MIDRRTTLAALVVVALQGAPTAADAQDPDFDVEVWTGLAQMPVAVARLELAGVPRTQLNLLVPALNEPDVSPVRFLEAARGIPILWERDRVEGDPEGEGMGEFVQAMRSRGLRGRELADAIHRELRRKGVPAGPKDLRGRLDVLDRDWVPDEWVDRGFRDDVFFRTDDEAARGNAAGRARGKGRLFGDVKGPRGRSTGAPGVGGSGAADRGDDRPALERKERGGKGAAKKGGPPPGKGKAGNSGAAKKRGGDGNGRGNGGGA